MDIYHWLHAQVGQLFERKICTSGLDGSPLSQEGLCITVHQHMDHCAGVARIMNMMDWGEATEFVTFGQVGKEEVDEATDVYMLIAPQNIVGNTILTVRIPAHVHHFARENVQVSLPPATLHCGAWIAARSQPLFGTPCASCMCCTSWRECLSL